MAVGLALRFERGNAVLAAVTLGATVVLWREGGFPHREKGLAASFVGPLLAVAWAATYPLLPTGTYESFLLVTLAHGLMAAAQLAWLSRGYGAIPFLAVVRAVARWANPAGEHAVSNGVSRYPFRLWWLLPAIPLAATALVLATSLAISHWLGPWFGQPGGNPAGGEAIKLLGRNGDRPLTC